MTSCIEDRRMKVSLSLAASKFEPICHGACVARFMAAWHFFRIAINSRNRRMKEGRGKQVLSNSVTRKTESPSLLSLIHFLKKKLWEELPRNQVRF